MTGPGRPRRMVRSMVVLALLAGSLSSCAGGESDASCIAVLEIDGATYYGRDSRKLDIPTTGEMTDAVVPGCQDSGQEEPGEEIRVDLIRDVPAATAVVLDDEIYVRGGVQLPEDAGDWYPSVSCRMPGEITLRGRLGGVSEPYQPYAERTLAAPYQVSLLVDEGSYAGTVLDVQVTAETESGLTAADRDRDRVTLRATVRCREGEFMAQSLQVG